MPEPGPASRRSSAVIQRRGDDHHDWALYGGAGSVGVEWYARTVTRLSSSVLRYRLEPGTSEGSHLHLAGDPRSCSLESQDELYLVLDGTPTMIIDGEPTVLGPGDSAYVPHGVPHGVRNDAAAAAELILVFGEPTANPYTDWRP